MENTAVGSDISRAPLCKGNDFISIVYRITPPIARAAGGQICGYFVKAAPAGDFVLEPDPADTDAAAPEADKAAEPAPEKAEQADADTGSRTQDNDENEQRKQ